MTNPLATYSFLPWLRQGIANNITDNDLAASVKLRAAIRVELTLTGEGGERGLLTASPINKDIQLYGPGDVVGIESRAIIKVEPRNWITNFEPNYLPSIDFYDEDFPWRYTPAVPDGTKTRLRPWIMLVVLKEGEFEEGANLKDKPLPFIKVADPSIFPPADQLWAWAHVHVNQSLAGNIVVAGTDMDAVLSELQTTLTGNPDLAYSRILCPRKLEANAPYHAFLIPVFESGRLAGLGLDPSKTPYATFSAWNTAYPNSDPPDPAITRLEPEHYPYYYRWYFRTGTVGDFEYLVRLLQPKPVDKRVGRRDLDVQTPGVNLPGITDPELGGILKLGGALQVPRKNYTDENELKEIDKYENWSQLHDAKVFQNALATLVNLADDYSSKTVEQSHQDANNAGVPVETGTEQEGDESSDPDPVISPPLYGRWHAPAQRLLNERDGKPISPKDNWVHELNLDPRFRVSAGFGTKVIQERQEEYMNAAWEQIGDVLETSRRIRAAQIAREISWIWYEWHLRTLLSAQQEKAFLLMAPIQKRVVEEGQTVYHKLKASVLQPVMLSAPMRRITRPRGRLVMTLPFNDRIKPQSLLGRINVGEISPAPTKQTPTGVVTINKVAEAVSPKDVPPRIKERLRLNPWLKYVPLVTALLIALLCGWLSSGIAWSVGIALISGLVYLNRLLTRWSDQISRAESLREENQTPEAVNRLPRSPGFLLSEPGTTVPPQSGTTKDDSPDARRFKQALRDLFTVRGSSTQAAQRPARTKLDDFPALTKAVFTAIDPDVTIPKRAWQSIILPSRLKAEIGERLIEPMGYPEFDTPMYKPLAEISSELFLPNINFVEPNSITILETNQKFIESYMLGLNHEFARELLWREYPTDQRGSYFRQFWDVSVYLDTENIPKDDLRDIPPLHKWPRDSKLGNHDHREAARRRRQSMEGGDQDKKEVVLVVRGELLKKYPTAVIYAHKAEWPLKPDGMIDKAKERYLVRLEGEEEDGPPRTKVKTPLYEAKVEPDIYFFGFDLTVEEAHGSTGENEGDEERPGWFFVIKERPGEPRFGLDLNQSNQLNIWNDLSWEDVLPGAPAGAFIQINSSFTLQTPAPGAEAEAAARQQQHAEDKQVRWDSNTNSADLAYILYQAPVLVAVHAAEMLPKP